jgi:hypothetical protein
LSAVLSFFLQCTKQNLPFQYLKNDPLLNISFFSFPKSLSFELFSVRFLNKECMKNLKNPNTVLYFLVVKTTK